MKTDAVVLLDLIDELRTKVPQTDQHAYGILASFNTKNGEEYNVTSFVNACCERLREIVNLLPDTTEKHRASFLSAIKSFEGSFGLGNMGMPWKQLFAKIESQVHTQAFHHLDFIIQSQGSWRARKIDAKEATEILDELETVIEQMNFPDYLRGVLKNEIAKMRFIISNFEKFGEQDYWDRFQKITGLFGSLYMSLDENARKQAAPILTKMIDRVTKGMAITADALQIASPFLAMLPKV